MIAKIQTKFDLGDVVEYKNNNRFSYYYGATFEVTITEISCFFLDSGEVKVIYDVEETGNVFSHQLTFSEIDENDLNELDDHPAHPYEKDFDTLYEFGQDVITFNNDNIYNSFSAPRLLHITKFHYKKSYSGIGFSFKEHIKEEMYVRGTIPTEDGTFALQEQSWDNCYRNITSELPDDYFDKVWNYEFKDRYFNSKYETDFEKLFKYLGVLEKARKSFDEFLSTHKQSTRKKAQNKSKVDNILESLSESEKEEILKKLAK